MKYTVLVTETAARELELAYDWLSTRTEQHAPKWYNGLLDAILSLEDMPAKYPIAPDADDSEPPTRQLLYGDKRHGYLILFEIQGTNVMILHIRHAARGNSED